APNVDAVTFFARRAFPTIRRANPSARFFVVGRNPVDAVRALADGNAITLTGAVPSTAPDPEKATVLVVPIRYSGGRRVEALASTAVLAVSRWFPSLRRQPHPPTVAATPAPSRLAADRGRRRASGLGSTVLRVRPDDLGRSLQQATRANQCAALALLGYSLAA